MPRPPWFLLEVPGDNSCKVSILGKMQQVRSVLTSQLGKAVNNAVILETALDFYLEAHRHTPTQPQANTYVNTYVPVNQDTALQENIFMITKSSLQKCIEVAETHGRGCKGNLSVLGEKYKGHVVMAKIQCSNKKTPHRYRWSSSPYLANGQYLINHVYFTHTHAVECFLFITDGLLPWLDLV